MISGKCLIGLESPIRLEEHGRGAIKRGVKNPSTGRKYTNADMPSEIDIMTDAMRTVRDTLPNYAYVSDFVKTFRRSILGNFVSWPAEIIRTTGRIAQIGLKEIKDPVLARQWVGKINWFRYRLCSGSSNDC